MTTANGLKRQQSERTRATLIQAATALLLDKGYAGTTLALLAKKVRMTKGAIYHHFADKEALLRAVMEHVRGTWEREVGAHIPPGGDALEQLGALFDHQARLIDQEPSLCLLVTGLTLQSRSLGRELAAVVEGITADMAELIRGILAEGQRAGTIRADLDAGDLARSVVAILKAISCSRATDPSQSVFLKKMQTTRTLVLSGIRRPAVDGRARPLPV
jgi:TetR/AcrR family transcriptional regulator, transcriptional repressor for nem operon